MTVFDAIPEKLYIVIGDYITIADNPREHPTIPQNS